MRHARLLFAAVSAAVSAACSASPTTPTFPDAEPVGPLHNHGLLGSGQTISISADPLSTTLSVSSDPSSTTLSISSDPLSTALP